MTDKSFQVSSVPANQSGNVSAPRSTVMAPSPQQGNTAQVAEPQLNTAYLPPPVLDTRFSSVDGLPSAFHFYPFKTLFMRLITPRDQFSLFRGFVNKSVRHAIEVVSACTQTDAYSLTVGDLWYLMYRLRLDSYKKATITIKWTCVADKHLEKVISGELSQESLQQTDSVSDANMVVNSIDPETFATIDELAAEILAEYGVHVRPITVRDWAEAVESVEGESEEEKAVLGQIDRYACTISEKHGSLQKRRELVVNHESPDLLADLEQYMELTSHGVDEFFNVRCRECGTIDRVKYSLDVPHFFPASEARRPAGNAVRTDVPPERAD